MKRISFFLFALALAAGCSSSTDPTGDDTDATDSEIKKGGTKKLACADVGGQCVGIHYQACQGGTWADANAVTCGSGIGVGCCVKPQPPPPPPPPPVSQCEAKGGQCVAITPTACADGTFGDASTHSCGGGIGVGCCITCPTLSPPAPGFCTGGTITPKKAANGCVTGYDCVKPAQTQCEAKGGECVALTPTSCAGGTWADATTHSCGGGLGVGCCIQ